MTELSQKASKKTKKSTELRKVSSKPKDQPLSRKHPRKAENPLRLQIPKDQSPDFEHPNKWVCKNSSCKSTLSIFDSYCKKCSCCICHSFDDNKDSSLWLKCSSKYDKRESCGLSCHVECAFIYKKVGVINLGRLMQLDGNYCCANCGLVSGVIGYWKEQMNLAKDARRVDILCYRLFLSYRLLKGTSKYKEVHEIVKEAKAKLETEVGPVDGVSTMIIRGHVSRLSVGAEVQKLCSLAIEKAEELLSTTSSEIESYYRDGSLPAACKFIFEEVTSTSVVIVLIELPKKISEEIKGYKLWYCKSSDETQSEEPISVFSSSERKFLISNLQPCTEYSFRIISYTDKGNLGHSEAKCFTKSIEVIKKNTNSDTQKELSKMTSSQFKVRKLGKILNTVGFDGLSGIEQEPSVSPKLDLNVASVPDLNEEAVPPLDSSMDEDAVNSRSKRKREKNTIEELQECNSSLANASSLGLKNGSGSFDVNFEYCVKIIRWLECEGHIEKEFRMKLLTWFSSRSTEQDRRVVNSYIQTMIDDPSSLAAQLVDSFSEILSNKRQRNGWFL
ncbi:VIN3-like protein 1 [Impatiens glandulifera]|uniref:VIN3-like protein 1 n=1 Tax=Impatiens glandulifera TaxID=253017 RepID=UPI001FB14037|nr:VIN3-like protein 1 [Impatiens glandulifera]